VVQVTSGRTVRPAVYLKQEETTVPIIDMRLTDRIRDDLNSDEATQASFEEDARDLVRAYPDDSDPATTILASWIRARVEWGAQQNRRVGGDRVGWKIHDSIVKNALESIDYRRIAWGYLIPIYGEIPGQQRAD
jgi:hypothetical protein